MSTRRPVVALALAASFSLLACSAGSPSRPAQEPRKHELHDREAARHAGDATMHASQFDPTAGGTFVPCDGPRGQCWRPTDNPTAPHAEQAAEHRAAAEAARKAAGWPRGAEEILCKGIPIAARGANPLDDVEIADVRALVNADRAANPELLGARLALRTSDDPSTLQHRIDCHVEHVSTRLDRYAGRHACPLVVPGAIGRVYETDSGVVLEVRAPDEQRAREVLRRAQAMTSRR